MTYIFGEKDLLNPIFVSFDIGYKNLTISKGVKKIDEKSWKVETLEKIEDKKEALNRLKQGINIEDNGKNIHIQLKNKFIVQKLIVKINGEEIKGHEYLQFII